MGCCDTLEMLGWSDLECVRGWLVYSYAGILDPKLFSAIANDVGYHTDVHMII